MENKPGINAKLVVKLYFFIAILMVSCVVAEFSNNISIIYELLELQFIGAGFWAKVIYSVIYLGKNVWHTVLFI